MQNTTLNQALKTLFDQVKRGVAGAPTKLQAPIRIAEVREAGIYAKERRNAPRP